MKIKIKAITKTEDTYRFVTELFWRYQRYCKNSGISINVGKNKEAFKHNVRNLEGHIFIEFEVEGSDLSRFKLDKGIHRCQRIPKNETRVYTSAVSISINGRTEKKVVYTFNYLDDRITNHALAISTKLSHDYIYSKEEVK